MALINSKQRYGSLSIALHWLVVIAFIGVYASIEFSDSFPKGSDMRSFLKGLHFSLGLSIFIALFVRIAARLAGAEPEIVPAIPEKQKLAAKAIHLALYLFMLGMPVAGYIARTLAGKVTYLFGIALPVFGSVNKELAGSIIDLHETVGNIGYFLIAAHAAAALFHHYVQKDNTLLRMLPERK